MILGILQTGRVSEEARALYGDYLQMFGRLFEPRGFALRHWMVVDGELPEGPGDADGWLITGSPHGVYEDRPWIAPLEALVRDIRDAGTPLIGICFGHQLVAQAFGGRVEKYPGGWALGRRVYDIGGMRLAMNAAHQDQVIDLPADAEILGGNAFTRHGVVAYGDRILTIQPHPEIDTGFMTYLLKLRGKHLSPAELDAAIAALDAGTDAELVTDWMAEVLRGVPVKRAMARLGTDAAKSGTAA